MPNKTLRDIAIEIGINVNTLKSRIYRAEMAGRPKARVKIKVAAELFPEFQFIAARTDKTGSYQFEYF